jgi:hypothetical protein
VLIPTIDQGIERLIRAELPLGETMGDISFDAPSGTWSAQLSRITINLYLFSIGRSTVPHRPTTDRIVANGRTERRRPLPMIELGYLVSVYAGSTRDEHQLLGDVMTVFEGNAALSPKLLPDSFESAVQLQIAPHDHARIKDIWSGVGGHLRPSLELTVTTALDGMPFDLLAPRAEQVEAMLGRMADANAARPVAEGG